MQKTKLTVRVPQDLLDNFRQYAKEKNTTMTSLIETYLRRIPPQELPVDAPIVRRLSGILSQQVSIEDYKKHMVDKYGS
jgi:antitoxin component of RelBE/YafQ-DinJ toxin-antitoxin module